MEPFRKRHLLAILCESDASSLPLDAFLRNYFKAHKSVGSKDRKVICETLYHLIRWRGLIDYFAEKPLTWEHRLAVTLPEKLDPSVPEHIRVSFPKWLFERIARISYTQGKEGRSPSGQIFGIAKSQYPQDIGDERGQKGDRTDTDDLSLEREKCGIGSTELCLASNEPAPITVRINPLKTTREALLEKWPQTTPCTYSPLGITWKKRENFFAMPEFKEGLFEVQDEGSQLVADLVDPKPGDHVLDYCSGSGGKTLAFAHKLQGKGQIYLHDIRPRALVEAKKRLKRAGIQNAQITSRFRNSQMDWILLDVPCSGTGTLRRNPDMKWKLTPEAIERLKQTQREIIDKAIPLLKETGKLVYATCSLLPEENQEQVSYIQERYGMKLVSPPFQSWPQTGGMDGFFGAVLRKR